MTLEEKIHALLADKAQLIIHKRDKHLVVTWVETVEDERMAADYPISPGNPGILEYAVERLHRQCNEFLEKEYAHLDLDSAGQIREYLARLEAEDGSNDAV